MRELPILPSEDFAKIKRYFPRPHGVERVDDLRVISGIIYARVLKINSTCLYEKK